MVTDVLSSPTALPVCPLCRHVGDKEARRQVRGGPTSLPDIEVTNTDIWERN